MVRSDAAPQHLHKVFALYLFAYLLTLFVAISVGYLVKGLHPVLIVFTADIAATLVIYVFGRIFHNASFYDAYWSLAPLAIALFWMFGSSSGSVITLRHVIIITLVLAWGLRLTYNWARQWQGLKHEDWRYRDLRKKAKGWFWLVDLIGIEMMPTAIVFLACLSLYPALVVDKTPFGILDIIAIVLTAGAVLIETIADAQLRIFIRKKPQPGEIFAKGLWAYSRHPNYFGEVTFWWGLFIFGLAADSGYWWTVIGPVAVTLLFMVISIPLMEKRNLERRPGYEELKKKVPVFLPWFPRT